MIIDQFIEEEQFYHYYQPIFDLKRQKQLGYEALLRSRVYPNPEFAFQAAKRASLLYELDTKSIKKAIATYQDANVKKAELLLFINVLPSTLVDPRFYSFITDLFNKSSIQAHQLVLEVSESETFDESLDFVTYIHRLRELGIWIALDDVGTGYANFNMIIEIEPDFIKLDRLFSSQLNQSKQKQSLIYFFQNYCQTNQIQLILEGLETKNELTYAKELGVLHAQGYYLGRPALLQEC
ncbi:EAL domain-containing protein (putative c-di-GMP-specific phosphodiesterase class I) [Natronobacillus azotifigens]|uniref:EAL domain-containing protein n=1 Tax=Natronobacillus azotifigens TaxID=472978 RepID=A0A9J6RCF1_9BACI|nr:EAL domain-containing protein [Natronobacillus azotifigens]MCZ0702980.1 EAL domain-containing protein [Natronobacillus azotifigens]